MKIILSGRRPASRSRLPLWKGNLQASAYESGNGIPEESAGSLAWSILLAYRSVVQYSVQLVFTVFGLNRL